MAFRTMRQNRRNKLLAAGFTKGEASSLSKIPHTSVPYMKDLIRFRRAQVKEWVRSGQVRTQRDLIVKINQWYDRKGFTKISKYVFGKGNKVKDPWQLLRFIEREFGYKYPSYVSPFRRKKQRDFQPFRGR